MFSNFNRMIDLYIMTDPRAKGPKTSAIIVFVSLLAPIVLTGFYLVYGLVGLIIEGQSKIKWSDEALTVGLRVLLLIVFMNALVMCYAWWKKVGITHPLWISPLVHIVTGVGLTALIAMTL